MSQLTADEWEQYFYAQVEAWDKERTGLELEVRNLHASVEDLTKRYSIILGGLMAIAEDGEGAEAEKAKRTLLEARP